MSSAHTGFGSSRGGVWSISALFGAAIGASLVGYRPVVEIMLMNFITVAMDQIVNHAAKLRFMSGGQTSVPITIRTRTGAGGGTGTRRRVHRRPPSVRWARCRSHASFTPVTKPKHAVTRFRMGNSKGCSAMMHV